MLTQAIKEKIQELFNATPNDIGVSYGKKTTNGQFTGELGITFLVETKRSLEEIPEGQVLPSSVMIDGIEYVTDVKEVGKIKTLACGADVLDNCYPFWGGELPNVDTYRPLVGGIALTSSQLAGYPGTFGFIAVDTDTQALVGVTNAHVLLEDPFYTSLRNVNGLVENQLSNDVYQNSDTPLTPAQKIGKVLRYAPLYTQGSGINYVDAALTTLASADVSNTESFKQYGLSYNSPMAFATTLEIDNLLTTNPPIYSSGRATGAKEGICGLTISQLGVTTPVGGYYLQGVYQDVFFNDVIQFTRINPDCSYPVLQGDSGSALIANFSGVWKIIGLVFSGIPTDGWAIRIDRLASQLGIEAWDGTPKNYINPSTMVYKTTSAGSASKTINCGGSIYWQVGLINGSAPC